MRTRTSHRDPRHQTFREQHAASDVQRSPRLATRESRLTRRRRSSRLVATLGAAAVMLLVTSGCGLTSTLPNPFASEPTPVPPAQTRPPAAPPAASAQTGAPSEAPAFTPIWVKNHRLTEMWSGPTDAPGTVSFGMTSQQFCIFQVVQPPDGPRVYVLNPYSQNYFWIDADAIGPIGPPDERPGPPPPGQNCADAVYTG